MSLHPIYGNEILQEHWGCIEVYLTEDYRGGGFYWVYSHQHGSTDYKAKEFGSRAAAQREFDKRSREASRIEAAVYGGRRTA